MTRSSQPLVEAVVAGIAAAVGSKAGLLRPETTLDEILEWMQIDAVPLNPLARHEGVMAIEEELGVAIPEEFIARSERYTFRELAEYVATFMQ